MKKIQILIFCIFLFGLVSGQNTSLYENQGILGKYKTTKEVRVGYGKVLAGSGDLWGHKFILGTQFFLTKHNAFDLRLEGTLIDVDKYFDNNPNWKYNQVSNGFEFVIDYNFILQYKKLRVYPSIGPVVRYSYEKQAKSYGIKLNSNTQMYDWYCDMEEDTGLRIGYNIGLNADFRLFKQFTIGPRLAFSQFPIEGYTFVFVGFTFIKHQIGKGNLKSD